MRITTLDAIGCHLHFEIDVQGVHLPKVYPFGGDPKARFTSTYGNYLRIDPLSILPWDPKILKTGGNGKKLPSWYYRVYTNDDGLPPPLVPANIGR